MPWTPNPQQALFLKGSIERKVFIPPLPTMNKAAKVTEIYNLLVGANNQKQAAAVLEAATSVQNIKDLAEIGWDRPLNNDANKLKSLFLTLPVEIQQIKAAKAAQKLTNDHINGYLGSISVKYKTHQSTGYVDLPVMYDPSTKMAVKYNNGEGVLPAMVGGGIYIEWYPFIGSSRSIGKRFFTAPNTTEMWYTEGGTHGATDEWWWQGATGGDWIKR